MARADGSIAVEVVVSPAPREVRSVVLHLPPGAVVADAVAASGLARAHAADLSFAIWGRKASAQTALRDGDRVALCRALMVDPKESRRQRFKEGQARLQERAPKKTKRPV